MLQFTIQKAQVLIVKKYFSSNFYLFSVNAYLILNENSFENNIAFYEGGGIFIKNNFQNFILNKTSNKFHSNIAAFGNDYASTPNKLRLKQKSYTFRTSLFNISVIPGITNVNLNFEILDFFNQTITTLNGRYPFFLIDNLIKF